LELRELILLIIGLGVSGTIAYKIFQWAIYEEIGLGLASVLLGFSILVFLAITNYDGMMRFYTTRQPQVGTFRKDVKGAAVNATEPFHRDSSEEQKGGSKTIDPSLEQSLLAATHSAEEAREMARMALQVARETKKQSERLGSIQAWAAWDTLMAEFLEVEDYLLRWEQRQGLRRGTDAARSIAELEKRLEAFGKSSELPEPIRQLYLKRQKKYEILSRLKEAIEPYAGQYVQMHFTLPPPPKLPSKSP
jgi:hypothetical protein